MRLYAEHLWDSPYVFTVMVALEEKQLPYELTVLNLAAGEQRSAAYQQRSLTGRVPAIEHDGFHLSESLAIVEYLEETYAPPVHRALLPADRHERARCRQVLGWLRSDLQALRGDRSTETMFFTRSEAPLTPAGRADADKLVRLAGSLLGDRDTLFSEFSIADADLAFMLARLHLNGDELTRALARYVERIWARPSVRVFVEQPRPATPG